MSKKITAIAVMACLLLAGGVAYAGAGWELETVLAKITGGVVEKAEIRNDLYCQIDLGNLKPGQVVEKNCDLNNISTNVAMPVYGNIYINGTDIGSGIEQISVKGFKQNFNGMPSEIPETVIFQPGGPKGLDVGEISQSSFRLVVIIKAAVNNDRDSEIGSFTVNLRVNPYEQPTIPKVDLVFTPVIVSPVWSDNQTIRRFDVENPSIQPVVLKGMNLVCDGNCTGLKSQSGVLWITRSDDFRFYQFEPRDFTLNPSGKATITLLWDATEEDAKNSGITIANLVLKVGNTEYQQLLNQPLQATD